MSKFDEVHNRIGTKSIKWNRFKIDNALPMWVADTDFKAPEGVIKTLSEAVEHGIFGYSDCDSNVDQSVVNWLKTRHKWDIDPSYITYCNGVVCSIAAIIAALTKEGDSIVVQPPVYPPFMDLVERAERNLVLNPLIFADGTYKINFEHLEELFLREDVKMLIFCSPHNPVGRVWNKEELLTLAELCTKYNVIILSDEIHNDIVFTPNKHIPVASLSKEISLNTVTCVAPSKTFNLAGLQSSVIVTENKDLKQKIDNQLMRQGFHGINYLGTLALESAYTNGASWLDEQNAYLKENVNLVKSFFQKHFPEVPWIEPEGTYLLWVNISSLVKGNENMKEALEKEAQLIVDDGARYGANKNEFIRINIGCPKTHVEEGLKRFLEFTKKHSPVL